MFEGTMLQKLRVRQPIISREAMGHASLEREANELIIKAWERTLKPHQSAAAPLEKSTSRSSFRRCLERLLNLRPRNIRTPSRWGPFVNPQRASGNDDSQTKNCLPDYADKSVTGNSSMTPRRSGFCETNIESKRADLHRPMPNAVIVLRHPLHPPHKSLRSSWGSCPRHSPAVIRKVGSDHATTDAFGNRLDDPPLSPAPAFVAILNIDRAQASENVPFRRTIARTVSLPPSIILGSSRVGTTPSGLVGDHSAALSAAGLEWIPDPQAYTTPLELHLLLEEMRRSLKASCGCALCGVAVNGA